MYLYYIRLISDRYKVIFTIRLTSYYLYGVGLRDSRTWFCIHSRKNNIFVLKKIHQTMYHRFSKRVWSVLLIILHPIKVTLNLYTLTFYVYIYSDLCLTVYGHKILTIYVYITGHGNLLNNVSLFLNKVYCDEFPA